MYRGFSLRRLCSALILALAIPLAGVAPSPTTAADVRAGLPRMTHATLILDFIPNAVHAGIYHALASGYYRQNNIDLTIIQPTSTSDTLKLIAAGKADIGIADGIDVANQIDQGRDAQAI